MKIFLFVSDSVLAYLKKNKLGKFNEEEMEKREALIKKEEELEEVKLNSIQIGNRCEVKVPSQPVRRAVVMFKGNLQIN
jgi:tubulin-folding cofactor B